MRSLYFALAIAAASAFSSWYVTDSGWQGRWDSHQLADYQANEKAAIETLTKQQKLLQELDNAYKTNKTLTDIHAANVVDSRIAADRLRAELNRIKTMPAITHTSTVAERANAATDRVVLAELLGVSDNRAGIYAAEADRLRIALSACNDEYDTVRDRINANH